MWGDKARQQALVRELSRTSRGVQKRRHNALCLLKPDRDELLVTTQLEANMGGLSAAEVCWEDERAGWEEVEFDTRPAGMPDILSFQEEQDVCALVKADMKALE